MARRTRKQRGGGGEVSKLLGRQNTAAGGGGGAAAAVAAPAPIVQVAAPADPEEEAIVSIHYLLTLLRGGPIATEPVYRELVEQKANLTRIVDRLEDMERRLLGELKNIKSRLNAERREIQAPFTRVRRGSFTENTLANRKDANNELRGLNASTNTERARRLLEEINALYIKTISGRTVDIRDIKSKFYQDTLRQLEKIVKLPQYCSEAERETIGLARDRLFLEQQSILYIPAIYELIQAYERDLNAQPQ